MLRLRSPAQALTPFLWWPSLRTAENRKTRKRQLLITHSEGCVYQKKARTLSLGSSPGWIIKCQLSWRPISPKTAVFACTEAGQAILGEIRKEQEVILLTEPDKANYTITPDSKRWKTTKKQKNCTALHSSGCKNYQRRPRWWSRSNKWKL